MEFTTIFFDYDVYTDNKVKLKKTMNSAGFKWNESKMKLGLSNEEIVNAFKFFKVDNRIINDNNLTGRHGSTGMWENGENAIKIIMFDKKNDDEHLPVLLVYKGNESNFYKEFIRECIKLGCEIGKIVETEKGMEELFKKRINIELIKKLDNVDETKKVMKEMFINRINELKNIGYSFADSFIKGWCSLIDRYGLYTDRMLFDEIEKKNMKNNEEKKNNIDEIKIKEIKNGGSEMTEITLISKKQIKKQDIIKGKKYSIVRSVL